MRVAVIHNLLTGGARRRLCEHLAHLDADIDVVEVTLQGSSPVTADPVVIPWRERAPAVARPLRPPLRYADLVALLRAWRDAEAALERLQPDVVFANPCRLLQAPPPLRRGSVPSLYYCDEARRVDYEPEARATRRALTRPMYGLLYAAERRLDSGAATGATSLVTNSLYTAAQIRAAYGREARIVRCGVPDRILAAAGPLPPRHLLSVGQLIARKGHDLVIAAAARARRRWPVLVISSREDLGERRRLQALAAAASVSLEIRVAASDDELVEAYRTAFATMYLSVREPFGLASLEAQAVGCPVIVSDQGGLPETLLPGRTGWVVPRSAAAAAERVDALEDAGERERLGEAARVWAADWTWRRSGATISGLLAELAA